MATIKVKTQPLFLFVTLKLSIIMYYDALHKVFCSIVKTTNDYTIIRDDDGTEYVTHNDNLIKL
jgi:hypothetical protein